MAITNPEKFAQKQHLATSANNLYALIRKYGVTWFDEVVIRTISIEQGSKDTLGSLDRVIWYATSKQFLLEVDNGTTKSYYSSWQMEPSENASETDKKDYRLRKNFYETSSSQTPIEDHFFAAPNGYVRNGKALNVNSTGGGGSFFTFDGIFTDKSSGPFSDSGIYDKKLFKSEILVKAETGGIRFILHNKEFNSASGAVEDKYYNGFSDVNKIFETANYNEGGLARTDRLFVSTVGYVIDGKFVNIDELSKHITALEDYSKNTVIPHISDVHTHNRSINVNNLDIVANGTTIERNAASGLCGQYLVHDSQKIYNGIINASIDTGGSALHQFYIGTQDFTKGIGVLANKVVLLHRSYSLSKKSWSNWEYWSKESEGYRMLSVEVGNKLGIKDAMQTYLNKTDAEKFYATKAALDANGVHFFNDILNEDVEVEETGCTLDAGDKIYYHTKKNLFLALHAETIGGVKQLPKFYSVFQNADGSIDSASYNNATSIRTDRFFVSDKGYIANGKLYAPDLAQFEQDLHDWVQDNFATQSDLEDAKSDIEEIERRTSTVEGDVSTIKQDIIDIKHDYATEQGVEDLINEVNDRIDENDTDIASLKNRVTTAEGKITTVEGKQKTLETQFDSMSDTWSAALNNLDSKVNALESTALKRVIVDVLPTEGMDEKTIYMLTVKTESDDNYCDEYMWIESKQRYEKIGSSRTSFDGLTTSADMNRYIAANQGLYGLSNTPRLGDKVLENDITIKGSDKFKVVALDKYPEGATMRVTFDEAVDYYNIGQEYTVPAAASHIKVELSLPSGTPGYFNAVHVRFFLTNTKESIEIMTEDDVTEIFANLV